MSRSILTFAIILTGNFLLTPPLSAIEYTEKTTKMVKEHREIAQFNCIKIRGNGTLFIKQGSKVALTIEGEANLLPQIKSEIQNNCLNLSPQENRDLQNTPLNYQLTVNQLEHIQASGNISIISKGTLNAKKFSLAQSGMGTANIKIKANKLNIQLSGTGAMILQGSANEQDIQISGAGQLNGKRFLTKATYITISGNGSAEINAADDLNVKIYGAGKIKYYGSPKITQQISGEGEIIPLS
jgi:hypothetical protein